MKYLAKIKYLGTDFHGFQVQPDKRTVQGELCSALCIALGGEASVTGCSRTDAGVHANEFFACVSKKGENSLECTIPMESVPLAFNSVLPNKM